MNNSEWIDASTEKPPAGAEVLVVTDDCGFRNIAIGSWYPRYWLESPCSEECDDEYREEDDTYYVVEGWYLKAYDGADFNDYSTNDDITHWMPKPKLPPSI